MALRSIRTEEDPILRKQSRLVEKFDERLQILIDDMLETMYDAAVSYTHLTLPTKANV